MLPIESIEAKGMQDVIEMLELKKLVIHYEDTASLCTKTLGDEGDKGLSVVTVIEKIITFYTYVYICVCVYINLRRAAVSLFESSSVQLRSNEDLEGPEFSNCY